MIYFFVFLLSTVFCYLGGSFEAKKQNTCARVFHIVAILIPAVLAGVRHESVGYDVRVYMNNLFRIAENFDSLTAYVNAVGSMYSNIGVGFSTLVYLVARLFNDVHWAYFFVNLLPMAVIYCGVKRNVEGSNWYIVWFMILLLLYNISLNLMRQIIAIAIIYWGHSFVVQRKPWKYFLACFAASLFHETAIVFAVLYFIYWFVNGKISSLRMIVSCVACVVCLFAYTGLLQLAVSLGILGSRFLTVYGAGIQFRDILSLMPLCVVFVVVFLNAVASTRGKKDNILNYYCVLAVLNFLLTLIGAKGDAYRIGYNTMIFMPEAILKASKIFDRFSRKIVMAIIVAFVICYWYYLFILNGFAATVPYISDIF